MYTLAHYNLLLYAKKEKTSKLTEYQIKILINRLFKQTAN